MANKTQNAYVAGTNKTRAGWGDGLAYPTWDESTQTWDEATNDWDYTDGTAGFPDGTNKTRNSKA